MDHFHKVDADMRRLGRILRDDGFGMALKGEVRPE